MVAHDAVGKKTACPVCLHDDPKTGASMQKLRCAHAVCTRCMAAWEAASAPAGRGPTCPLCRARLSCVMRTDCNKSDADGDEDRPSDGCGSTIPTLVRMLREGDDIQAFDAALQLVQMRSPERRSDNACWEAALLVGSLRIRGLRPGPVA